MILQPAQPSSITGYRFYRNGDLWKYRCVIHDRWEMGIGFCRVCRGIPNGWAGIPPTQSR